VARPVADVQAWAPRNGASLAYVASKRGWPAITVVGATVARASNGIVYYSGDWNAAMRALQEL